MTILFAASEMVPFCKTGGLADVLGALPPMLAKKGHEVVVMLPGYSVIDRDAYGFKRQPNKMTIPLGLTKKPFGMSKTNWNGITVCLMENEEYFDRPGLYGDSSGDYPDNGSRFIFFSRAVLAAARCLHIRPDIVHAHDWQAALICPYLVFERGHDPVFGNSKTLFTIHNLGYQGKFPFETFKLTGLPDSVFTWTKLEFWGDVSFLKGGLVFGDALSTVSGTYAEEITTEELGFGMHGVLSQRRDDLYGIVNGIDQELWNPETDTAVPARYSSRSRAGKEKCRKTLLKRCGFKASGDTPIFGMVTRLDDQKGLDIFEKAMPELMKQDIRLVVLGTGSEAHHETMRTLAEEYPEKFHVSLAFDDDFARLIYAGADAFLMPSRYEPCGLGQLIAMRYGTLPVVHATGGLADTVADLGEDEKNGNGFVFTEYSSDSLTDAVNRAVNVFRKKNDPRWENAVYRAMTGDYSWDHAADKYLDLYERIGNRGKR